MLILNIIEYNAFMKTNENKFHKKGAEAVLFEDTIEGERVLIKKRKPKSYRNSKLDLEIRKKRTKSEAKLLREASKVVNTPKVISVNEELSEIVMDYIPGKPLKLVLEKKSFLCTEAGEKIRKLHEVGIIHGDLTTSNIIYVEKVDGKTEQRIEKNGPLFFIDFGLGYFSKKIEDRATDLVVFKKTFNATHSIIKNGWAKVMKGYRPGKELEERMKLVEKRARYH